ncbi:hypothetical protein PGTUg99_003870 [Puccinia graminis f. sp. tritici]|uniref:Uncharacterized protein n=1 Tax=Puccinia graminis f. sp. tritici TaxID=56615 RepID=A0A5B0LW47_PUCGR|nr:hypothetical protein PGTUg99_003870 [Puccinia graminis f. sp. tritici]
MSENNQPAPAAGSSVGWPAVATFLFNLIPQMSENNKQLAFQILSNFLSKITDTMICVGALTFVLIVFIRGSFASRDSTK